MRRQPSRACGTLSGVNPVLPSDDEPLPPLRWLTWLAILAACLLVGLLKFTYFHLGDLTSGSTWPWQARMVNEMEGGTTAFLLMPVFLWMARHVGFPSGRRGRALLLHLMAATAVSAIATTVHLVVRARLYSLLHLPHFNPGPLPLRYGTEYSNDVLTYTVAVGAFILFDIRARARRRELATAHLETQLARAQLQNLRLQLQPHFLFNTLHMVSSAMYDDVAMADAMLTRLSDLLRHTLCAPPAQEVSLQEELHSLRLYLDILQARFGDRLQIRYAIAVDAMTAVVPQLLLQPLAENAIRHGADPSSSGIEIEVQAERSDGHLLLWIRDRGPGFGSSANGAGHGLGLKNTRERLHSLYGAGQEMVCRNRDGGGAEVFVRLPWRMAAVEVSAP